MTHHSLATSAAIFVSSMEGAADAVGRQDKLIAPSLVSSERLLMTRSLVCSFRHSNAYVSFLCVCDFFSPPVVAVWQFCRAEPGCGAVSTACITSHQCCATMRCHFCLPQLPFYGTEQLRATNSLIKPVRRNFLKIAGATSSLRG